MDTVEGDIVEPRRGPSRYGREEEERRGIEQAQSVPNAASGFSGTIDAPLYVLSKLGHEYRNVNPLSHSAVNHRFLGHFLAKC